MTQNLRVISYNIHKGFAAGNRRFVLGQIRDVLRGFDADLVFLQEVCGENAKHEARVADWPTESQFEFLADSVWSSYVYGKNAVYSQGHHGNAILSKYPITGWENLDVSTNRFEQRGILHATVAVPGWANPVHALCTHLNLRAGGRRQQIAWLEERVKAAVPMGHPLVLAGDFNEWTGRATDRLEEQLGVVEIHRALHGAHARTFPSWFPVLRLDRIYCRGVVSVKAGVLTGRPWNGLSDHGAVWGEVGEAHREIPLGYHEKPKT